MADVAQRIAALAAELHRHNRLYHEQNQPEISDWEYDRLFRELEELERLHPGLAPADSPTRRVGSTPIAALVPFPHAVPMLSLQNGRSATMALRVWSCRVSIDLPSVRVIDLQNERISTRSSNPTLLSSTPTHLSWV